MIFVLGDIHFGVRRNSVLFHQILLNELYLVLDKITKKDSVIILGDVFDSRSSVDFKILNDAVDFFIKISRKAKDIFILVGNHDLYYKENSIENVNCRFLSFDSKSDEVCPIKIIQSLSEINIQNNKCLFVPWIDGEESKIKALDKIKKSKVDFIFGHIDICELYGNDANELVMFKETDFPENVIVLSGHYHKRLERNPVKYVGSLINMTFNDVGDTKGYHIIRNKEVKFIEGTSPKFEQLKIDKPNEFYKAMTNISEERLEKFKNKIKGNIIKLILNEYCSINDKIYDFIKKMSPLLLSVSYNRFSIENGDEGVGFNGFDVKSDIVDIISEYIDKVENKLPTEIKPNDIKDLIHKKHLEFKSMS